ncbi:MAG: hypothetical protein L3K04_06240 [Thermoplasmata archaeon]|nr:hypothetical protein [Thermoplasmata archaeon]
MGTPYRSYRPPTAPSPRAAPSAPEAPSPLAAPSPRYAYLVSRLQNRQITMEEATELFQLQQRTIQEILAQANVPPTATRPAPPSATPSPTGTKLSISDDSIGLGLVALGAAAGILAALLRKSADLRNGPPPPRQSSTG